MAEHGGVEGAAPVAGVVGLNRAQHGRDRADFGGDFAGGLLDIGDEADLEEQIARRIAADDQFGENHEFGALPDQVA